MAEYKDREHYIPLRWADLVRLLCEDNGIAPQQAKQLRQLADLLTATIHFEYHKLLEDLKDAYAPFDPDATTRPLGTLTSEQRTERLERMFLDLKRLMERANFNSMSIEDFRTITSEASPWGLNMDIDFSIFEHFDVYHRGDVIGTRYRRSARRLWRTESLSIPIYQRLLLAIKLKPSRRLPVGIDTDNVFIKLFKDIPRMDMEMLLPGARMRMPSIYRLKLGGSFLSGSALIGYNIVKPLVGAVTLGISYLWGPLFAVAGYGYKQYYGYRTTKNACTLQLTQSLYYHNLDNNAGVLNHLIDEAEEQDCREAFLAYYYLWRYAGANGWRGADLDDYVELDLERLANLKVDFEIADALAKLERLKLVTKNGDRYIAEPIDKALEHLDYAWDNYFEYNKGG